MLSVMARKIGLWKICLTDSNAKAEAYSVELLMSKKVFITFVPGVLAVHLEGVKFRIVISRQFVDFVFGLSHAVQGIAF